MNDDERRRAQMRFIAKSIRVEASLADRPGEMDRLETLAAVLESLARA